MTVTRPSVLSTAISWVVNVPLRSFTTWSHAVPSLPRHATGSWTWRRPCSWEVCRQPRPNSKFAIATTTDASRTFTSTTNSSTWPASWPTTAPLPVVRKRKISALRIRAATEANAARVSALSSASVPMAWPAKIVQKVSYRSPYEPTEPFPWKIKEGNAQMLMLKIPMLSYFVLLVREAIEGSRQFRGDGYLIFTPDAKPIVLPWSASFAFRTRQTDSFLMKLEIEPAHFVLVEVRKI